MNRIIIIILGIIICISCKYDYEFDCKDVEYGSQVYEGSTELPFPFHTKETLVFKDSLDHELKFAMVAALHGEIDNFWVNFSRDSEEGICAGKYKINALLEQKVVNFRSDSLDYLMISTIGVFGKIVGSLPIFYEYLHASMEQVQHPANLHIEIGHLTNARGNSAYITFSGEQDLFIDQINLLGRHFTNVYAKIRSDGSELYFNHDFGFIAFKEIGKPLWVLDRIE